MPTTTVYGIDYPANTDLVTNGAAQMQLLAGDVETAVSNQVVNLWGRNFVHNSAMRLNYRNAQSNFIADRWLTAKSGTTTAWARSTYTSPQTGLLESIYNDINANITVSTLNTDYVTVTQNIEGVRSFANKTVKVSFYAKAASGTPKVGVSLDQVFGTGGTPSATVNGTGQAVTISTTWTRYNLTFSVPSISGKTLGTAGDDYVALNFWLTAGTTYATRAGSIGNQTGQIYLTGIQAETDYLTAYEVRPDALEELICARYFFTTYNQGVYLSAGGAGAANATGVAAYAGSSDGSGYFNVVYPFPTTMWKAPTVTFYVQTTGALGSWDMLRSGTTSTAAMQLLTAGNSRKSMTARTTASIGLTWIVASMYGHFAADTGW